ncbi:hypothetical protein F5Y05DRAFT_271734 [Hypoxylon sp. FL0543]|nr:hypothetical protein F5Y05DRAFT_271734 [Hypoxylon sp. FL0543]
MSSDDVFGTTFDDSSPSDQPISNNPPWPRVDRLKQAQIERRFFEDGATIHYERLPTLQSWTPLFLISDSLRVAYVTTKVVGCAKLAARRLTAEEVDGASEAAAISCRYLPWIQPVSMIAASLISWRTRRSFGFAFYRPKPGKIDPTVFPMRRAPIFTGRRAYYAWHAARFLTYFPPVWFGSLLFFSSLAETSYEARLLRDPRLRNIMTNAKRNARHFGGQHGNLPQSPGAATSHPSRETHSTPSFPRGQFPSQSGSQSTQDYGHDTYTSQAEDGFTEPATRGNTSTTASVPQSSYSRNAQPQVPPSKSQGARYPESDPRNADYDADLFDGDDDASPVSAAARRAEAQQARDAQSGSAWDRIRRQSQSDNSQWAKGDSSGQERGWAQLRQDKAQNAREWQPKTESFAYTKEEEDRETRKYEREQAQKDFDALLEAERRGDSNRGS